MAKKMMAKQSAKKTNMIGEVKVTAKKKKMGSTGGELTRAQETYRRAENKKRSAGGKLGVKKVTAGEARKARPNVKKKK
jgi:hypothetical protein